MSTRKKRSRDNEENDVHNKDESNSTGSDMNSTKKTEEGKHHPSFCRHLVYFLIQQHHPREAWSFSSSLASWQVEKRGSRFPRQLAGRTN
jgi:hypothetical protein